ncbi:Dipeptidyl peptidase 9 [Linderina macrospora]|uniref:Dipeptidyl peptidase 9 n=1 Tax=Linderina macrospora TaxID=4868 RepID=A0ACC1JEE6_9FUNG|nr:Dipeptidyl peptidase 9 [Linderina macrospora]
MVYFSARNPNPLTANLFVASYTADIQSPTEFPRQLTMAGYTHSHFVFDSTGQYFYCQSSNVTTPSRHCIYQTDSRCLAAIEVARLRSESFVTTRSSIHSTSTYDFRSISIDSLESDAFSDYLPNPLRMGGKLRRATREKEFSIRRLTPSYVGQTVSRAVRSAIPFSLFQSLALGTIKSGINPQRLIDKVIAEILSRDGGSTGGQSGQGGQAPVSETAVQVAKQPSTAPPLPPRPVEAAVEPMAEAVSRYMLLTNANQQFVTKETLIGTHEYAGMPVVNKGSDPAPKLFCFHVPSGDSWDLLFSHVYLPPDFIPGRLYPVVVNAYGGPQCQLVTNAYPYLRHRRLAMLTRMTPETVKPGTAPMFALRGSSCRLSTSEIDDRQVDSMDGMWPNSAEKSDVHSMVVVCVDGRGTPKRGLKYESAIYGKLGQLEVDDIASAVEYLLAYGLDALTPVDTVAPVW